MEREHGGRFLWPGETRRVRHVYHHWRRGYLQQYLNEFDFRYNNRKVNDSERAIRALKLTEGKRLTLCQPKSASA